jgi:hypothetical protein
MIGQKGDKSSWPKNFHLELERSRSVTINLMD